MTTARALADRCRGTARRTQRCKKLSRRLDSARVPLQGHSMLRPSLARRTRTRLFRPGRGERKAPGVPLCFSSVFTLEPRDS